MEYTLAGSGAEQALLAGLQFNLPPQSNYILTRRPQVAFFTSGASSFTPNGVRVARVT